MDVRKQAHATYRCEYHLVWTTKYRYKILTGGVTQHLEVKLDEIRRHYPDIIYLERSIQPDHVHLMVVIPPKYAVATAVQYMKQNTSRSLKEKFDFIRQKYSRIGSIWSIGYFASTVGLQEKVIRAYIKNQEKEDVGQAQLALI